MATAHQHKLMHHMILSQISASCHQVSGGRKQLQHPRQLPPGERQQEAAAAPAPAVTR